MQEPTTSERACGQLRMIGETAFRPMMLKDSQIAASPHRIRDLVSNVPSPAIHPRARETVLSLNR